MLTFRRTCFDSSENVWTIFSYVDNLNVPPGDIQDEPPTTTEMMVNATEGKPFKFLEEVRGGRGYRGTLDSWIEERLAVGWYQN